MISITRLKYKECLLFLLFIVGNVTPCFSSAGKSELKQYITEFVLENSPKNEDEDINVEILKLDNNFHLPPCDAAVTMAFAQEGIPTENNTIVVSCPSSPYWKIHVPIKVQIYTHVIAASHYIPAGTQLSDDDLYLARHDKKMLREGYFKESTELIGLFTSHSIGSGVVFSPKNVKRKSIVKRNQTIKLVLNHGGIMIDMVGKAKSDGALNDVIKVMNPSSKKVVDAVVTGSDRAEINL